MPFGRRRTLVIVIITTLLLIGSLLVWDVRRESDAAVRRLLHYHSLVALALAQDFSTRLATAVDHDEREALLQKALADARNVERAGNALVLVRHGTEEAPRTTAGAPVRLPAIIRALRDKSEGVVLTRSDAQALGLPDRVAVAAIDRVADDVDIVVVASAREARDRFRNYQYRLVAGLVVAVVVIGAFAWLVLREQRRQHALDSSLTRERIAHERDEQLSRADRMASLAALALGIGHELATPLGVILGRVEEARHAKEESPRNAALTSIQQQVQRIRGVLQGFLSLARGERPAMIRTPVSKLVDDATALVRHRFTSVELVTHVDDTLHVRCDPTLFPQVLVNLLVNACSFSDPGSQVELNVARNDNHVTFEVLDNGIGIASDVAARADVPFFTTRRSAGGSGLGLSIAREIVQHHGGVLTIEPKPNRGTIARVTVPADITP